MPDGKTEVIASENIAEITINFVPTTNMYKWRNIAFELGYTATVTMISRKCGVNERSWYNWQRVPGFLDWWQAEWQEHMKAIKWKLDSIGMDQAKHDFSYWKAMKFGVQEFENKTQVNTQVNISDAVIERLKEK